MATIGPNYVNGITTPSNNTDIASKQYADNHIGSVTATTESDERKNLISQGSNSRWEYLSERLEFETGQTTNNTIPDKVNKILISASGGGGGGGAGEVDGSKVPKLTSWTQRTGSFSSYSHYYYGSITYGNSSSGNKWINTGQSARIETSTDAISWTTRTHGNSSNSSYWWDGIYANNQFLLVGYNYSVIASTDAIHWQSRTANFSVQYNTVNYGADGNYCISGDSGRIIVSTDTINWIARTGPSTSDYEWIGYLNNAWHVCGQSNNYGVSTDTIHWTKRTIGNSSNNMSATYHPGEGIYLVFKESAHYQNNHGIWASTDSITWVARTSDFGNRQINYDFRASEYIPSIQTVIACGTYVSTVVSTDTIHWTYSKTRPEENGSEPNYDIATDDTEKVLITGQYYVMIRESPLKNYGISGGGGGGGAALKYEINGNNISKLSTLDVTVAAGGRGGGKVHSQQWTLRTMGISTNRLEQNGYPAVQYGGYWVVGSKISASTDSIHWSARTLPPLPASTQAWGVAYGDLLLMTSGDNYFLCTSTDSIVWTLRTTSLDDNREMFYDGKGTWLVGGRGSTNGLVTSTDSIHWKRRTLGATLSTQTGFAYDGSTYVVGTYISNTGKSNGLSSSTDTIHWTKRTIGFGSLNTKKVNYNYGTLSFYVVGEGNGLFASTDAIHWGKRTVPFSNSNIIYSYSTGYNQHVIGSKDGIATSTDSIHWTKRTHNFNAAEPRYIGYGDEKFMVTNSDNSNNNEIAILDVSAQDGEDTTISWKGKGLADFTINGNVSVNTTTKPTGASSSYSFDGNGDNLTVVETGNDFTFGTGDFTIEFYLYSNNTNQAVYLDWRNASGNQGARPVIYYQGGSLRYNVSGTDRISYTVSSTNIWNHIALCRSGTSTKMFINRSQVGSTYSDSNDYLSPQGSEGIYIGAFAGGSYDLNGYISNLRIIKGKALYPETLFDLPELDLQFTGNTVLLTCNGNEVSALNAQQTYSITVPGGKSATKNTGASRIEASSIPLGYTYIPEAASQATGLDNDAFGQGANGSSGNASAATGIAYQSPSGGGGGGAASYPQFGKGGSAQGLVYSRQSFSGLSPNTSFPGDGNNGGTPQNKVFGTGGTGGSAASTQTLGAFSRRTFYNRNSDGNSGYGKSISGRYIDYLNLYILATNPNSGQATEGNNILQVSTDTIHWTLRTYPLPGNSNTRWTTRGEHAKPVDSDGTQVLLSNNNYDTTVSPPGCHTLASSTDTIHWKLRTIGNSGIYSNTIKYANNTWIQTYNSTSVLSASTDSIHWKLRTIGQPAAICDLTYGNGRWVATNSNGGSPYTSTDTIHWKARTAPLSNSYQGRTIIYAEPKDGENIFVYGNYANLTWSTDGIRWFSRSQSNMHYVKAISYSPVLNKYIVNDYYGYVYEFDASGPLEDLFTLNKTRSSDVQPSSQYSPYHCFSPENTVVVYYGNQSHMIKGSVMSIFMGSGGSGGPGAGGGGASVLSKSGLSAHGGDGGDGRVHINMI